MHPLITLFIVAAILVNVTSSYVYKRLIAMVGEVEDANYMGDDTALVYAQYLYFKLMDGPWFKMPPMVLGGDPNRNPVIREVRESEEYQKLAKLSWYLNQIPVNIFPWMLTSAKGR